jgi:hypothetical protein
LLAWLDGGEHQRLGVRSWVSKLRQATSAVSDSALAARLDAAATRLAATWRGASAIKLGSAAANWPASPITRRTWAACLTTSSPPTVARPASGRSEVARMDTVVVLPDPFGPSRPSTDPAGTARLSPSSACTWPQAFRRPQASTAGLLITQVRYRVAAAARACGRRYHRRLDI